MNESVTFEVLENETRIGKLSRLGEKLYIFEYAPDYVAAGGHSLCVTMPIATACFYSDKLHPFFTNYLSEGWYAETQKRHLDGSFSPTSKTADLMACFGSCFGAMRFRLVNENEPDRTDCFETDPTSGFGCIEPDIGYAEKAMIPGAQPKVLAVQTETPGVFRLADQTESSTHIGKIVHSDYKFQDVLNNEYLSTQVVKHLLPHDTVCEMELGALENLEEQALFIKRFDRNEDGKRVPFYEFNQLLGKTADDKYSGAYADMADFIYEHAGPNGKDGFKTDLSDARLLFQRVLVDILIGNTDAHLKNFALIKDGKTFRLSPNYDLLSNSMYGLNRRERFDQYALMMGGRKSYNLGSVDAKCVVMLAHEFQIEPEELLEDIKNIKDRLDTVEEVLRPFEKKAPTVTRHLRDMMRKRWNGSFANIENMLRNRPPKNVFADKTSRERVDPVYKQRKEARTRPRLTPPQRTLTPQSP